MNDAITDNLELTDEDTFADEVSDEALEAASRAREAAAPTFSPASLTVSFVCCSVA